LKIALLEASISDERLLRAFEKIVVVIPRDGALYNSLTNRGVVF